MGIILRMRDESGSVYPFYIPFSTDIKNDYYDQSIPSAVGRSWFANNVTSAPISFAGSKESSSRISDIQAMGGIARGFFPTNDSTKKFYLGAIGSSNYFKFITHTSGESIFFDRIDFYTYDDTLLGDIDVTSSYHQGANQGVGFALYMVVGIDENTFTEFGTIAVKTSGSEPFVNIIPYSQRSSGMASGAKGQQGSLTPAQFISWIGSSSISGSDTDPSSPGGESEASDDPGYFDGSSDTIGVPALPTISAVDSGFVTLYNPNTTQLKSLASYMWSTDFLENLVKTISDPIDSILSLAILPVAIPNTAEPVAVKVGNVETIISMYKATAQYIEVSCGSIVMKEYWGSALDYSPNTRVQIYLPFIGYKFIDTDDVMKNTISVTYHVDILTGSCVCYVSCGGSVKYQYEGNCACFLPVTGTNWSNIIGAAVRTVGTVASIAATGSPSAGVIANGLVNTVGNVMSSKMVIERGGTSSGSGGQMSVQKPYLVVTRPRQSLAKNYNRYEGYPSNITTVLSSCKGYTAVESIHLEGVNATDAELDEIISLLKGGVII